MDDQGWVWIATFSGLYLAAGDGQQVFGRGDGLIDDNVGTMAFDQQGRVSQGSVGAQASSTAS